MRPLCRCAVFAAVLALHAAALFINPARFLPEPSPSLPARPGAPATIRLVTLQEEAEAPRAAPAVRPPDPVLFAETPLEAAEDARAAAGEDGALDGASPGEAAAEGDSAALEAYTRYNYRLIQRRIQAALVYPARAKRNGAQGLVEASFVVGLDGSARAVRVLRSSGADTLDHAAVQAVLSAAPFPPPPAELRLIIPVSFKLR